MSDDESEHVQLRFEEGRLVERSIGNDAVGADYRADPIQPGDEDGFVVAAKSGALEINRPLAEAVEMHGQELAFGSRSHAESYARQLSASGGALRVQRAAPNDDSEVDAYFLADHDPSVKEPAEVDGDTWTFDVGANLYGELGEALLLHSPRPHALQYFVRQDLARGEGTCKDSLVIDVQPGKPVTIEDERSDARKTWVPDCIAVARDGPNGGILEQYFCEIKTGNASFQRSQVDVMEHVAREERVLKIRMLIKELPEQYSVRIQEVGPPA